MFGNSASRGEVMPSLPVFQIRTLREVRAIDGANLIFLVLLGIAGAMALLLGIGHIRVLACRDAAPTGSRNPDRLGRTARLL